METKHLNTLIDRIAGNLKHKAGQLEELVKKYIQKAVQKKERVRNAGAQIQQDNQISVIPPEGIVIDKPGNYQFTKNITWLPGQQATAIAIDIVADDVTLDLQGYSLVAVPVINTNNVIGINITGNDVTIKNGVLVDMLLHGISASLCNNLTISGVAVQGSEYSYLGNDPFVTASGIYVELSENITLQNCQVSGANVTAPAYAGIQLSLSTHARVTDCQTSHLINNDGTVTGFSYVGAKHITTANCHATKLRSYYLGQTTTFGHTVLGFLPTACKNLTYENCTAISLRGCCDDCHGMSIFDSDDITVTGFSAIGIVDGDCPTNTGAKATGLEVYGNNISIQYCQVQNIFAIVPQDKQSCGFSAAGNNITFEACVAYNVFVFDENRNLTKNAAKYGYGIGFGWAPDPRQPFVDMNAVDTVYTNCGAIFCQVGFDTWNHIGGQWNNCSVEDCLTAVLQEDGGQRIFTMDKCSELPPNMTSPMTIINYAANNTFNPPISS
ncbi:hypothetical protein [Emticicia sp. TH156]|uniref:hypothetical protein n=1 Tax=Emticicia sp. TH156 TaxID=2067454 RepID=UPI000C78FA43|nr:hypothetical protein [Emticicia sp. TH156]PLK44805.1 hypothetical protein C0V77_10205 [Emticicia sp. TH156]